LFFENTAEKQNFMCVGRWDKLFRGQGNADNASGKLLEMLRIADLGNKKAAIEAALVHLFRCGR